MPPGVETVFVRAHRQLDQLGRGSGGGGPARHTGTSGLKWTAGPESAARPLEQQDLLVVAAYNAQVHLIRKRLEPTPGCRRVRVGTVDKFQGQEAPVVLVIDGLLGRGGGVRAAPSSC